MRNTLDKTWVLYMSIRYIHKIYMNICFKLFIEIIRFDFETYFIEMRALFSVNEQFDFILFENRGS